MKPTLFLVIFSATLFSSSLNAQIRDTSLYVSNGLSIDARPNIDNYKGVKTMGSGLMASQNYLFVQMLPSSQEVFNDTILYLLHEDYRGQAFDAPSLNTRSQKAAVLILDCESQAIRIQQGRRRLIPPQGCEFKRYRSGMTFKGKKVIVIPKY